MGNMLTGTPKMKLKKKRTRVDAKERREMLLAAACRVAERDKYDRISRFAVAEEAQVSETLITHYFKTMPQLRRDVMRYAVRNRVVKVIAQGILMDDPHVKKIPPQERAAIISDVVGV